MSLLVPKESKIAKITASSSLVTLKDKKIGGGALVKKKISESNNKIITITNKLNEIQEVRIKTERIQINQLKAEPAAEEKIKTEKLLETEPEKKEKKKGEDLKIPKPSTPNLVDRIFEFLALTGLNWLIGKLSDKTSGITGIFDFIQNVLENIVEWFPKFLTAAFSFFEIVGPWIQGIGQFVFNAFVGAIDLAYQTYDGLRSLTGTIFGDKGVERFDEFSGILSNVIAGAITLGTAMIMFSDDLKGFGGGRRGETTGINGRSVGGTRTTSPQAARRYAQRFGRDAAIRRFGQEGVRSLGGRYARSGATNLARKGITSALGRSGTKLALKFLRPILKRIPVIGGLVDFVVSLAMGESLGRAAAKSVGATLGAALGTLIPIPGVGTIAGGILGDLVGGKIYDAVTGGGKTNDSVIEEDNEQELNSGGRVKIGSQDFRDLAYIVSGEAARNTNDEYGVAAAVLNRVASPVWPNNVRSVGFQAGQFEAVYTGKAKDDPMLAEKLSSPEGQAKIASAMRLLNGRTDFKGQSMLSNKGSSDIMFDPRGNFFHYTTQRRKDDPVPQNPNQSWKRLIGTGGPKIDLSTTSVTSSSSSSSSVSQKSKEQKEMQFNPLGMLLNKLGITGNTLEQSEQIGSPTNKNTPAQINSSPSLSSTNKNTPAQISSSPSSALSTVKSNITKTSQSLPYQKIRSKPAVKVAVLVKEKTRNIIT